MFIDWNKIFLAIYGLTDEESKAKVERWKKQKKSHEKLYDDAVSYYHNTCPEDKNVTDEQIDDLYLKLMDARGRKRQLRLRYTMATAASIAILIIVGAGYFMSPKEITLATKPTTESPSVVIISDNGTILTPAQLMADSSIALDNEDNINNNNNNNRLEYSADKNAAQQETKLHTIKIPRGTSFELMLSDGTFIMLSPETILTYPVSFKKGSIREVTLSGEAYFEVTKSSDKFVVNTNKMKLQVYGTKFNINSRENRPDQTVLLDGIVGVSAKGTAKNEEVILKPGQMSRIAADGKIHLTNADLTEYEAKREGYILFNGKPLIDIAEILELYYDVKVKFESSDLQNIEIVASVKRGDSLTDVLETIEYASRIKFTIKGKEVYIKKK